MASLDDLPADQRAVLQLVLQRGRTYDEIARLLSIDRAAVRARALAAFDALGPQTRVPPERRALITDYLLGQLPPRVRTVTRDRLAESAIERAWARVLSGELAPVANRPLPDIPTDIPRRTSVPAPAAAPRAEPPPAATATRKPKRESVLLKRSRRAREPREAKPKRESVLKRSRREREPRAPRPEREPRAPKAGRVQSDGRRISRRGGAILLGSLLVVVVVAAIALLSKGSSAPLAGSTAVHTSSTAAARATSTPSTSASVVAQVNLTPPSGRSKAAGIAEVLRQGATKGIAIVAQHVLPNTIKPPSAYAVWLYNSPTDARILGFVNPGVGSNGRLSTAGQLPANASHFKELVVTLETSGAPKTPGTIVLQGKLTGI